MNEREAKELWESLEDLLAAKFSLFTRLELLELRETFQNSNRINQISIALLEELEKEIDDREKA